jgi:methionyl-tRNA formyltransferase
MRIVFVGAVDFSRHCLQEVLRNGGQVVGVVTLDRRFASFNADYADLSDVAKIHKIPIYKIERISDPQTVGLIRSLKPDVLFVFGWSQLIPKEILEIPLKGCIGTHPALLPRNRGRHPLIWALVEGLKESGMTFFYLDEGADSGDILWQKAFPITLEDDAGTLYQKIKELASEAIPVFLRQLENGTAPRTPQNHSRATYWRKRGEKDGEIRWDASSMEIYNLIRALTHPYVGAHTYWGDHKVIVWKGRLEGALEEASAPGKVLARTPDGLRVRTGDGYVTLLDFEVSGGAEIPVGSALGRG